MHALEIGQVIVCATAEGRQEFLFTCVAACLENTTQLHAICMYCGRVCRPPSFRLVATAVSVYVLSERVQRETSFCIRWPRNKLADQRPRERMSAFLGGFFFMASGYVLLR